MSMLKVAQLAGVSVSTVSRVVNNHSSISHDTAATVRRAMASLNFDATSRGRAQSRQTLSPSQKQSIGFLIFGTSGYHIAPGFQSLLQSVSESATEANLNLLFSFVNEDGEIPPRFSKEHLGGVLLHGIHPSKKHQAILGKLPTVWLMANPQRAEWGDQVMPNNAQIGELAVGYLLHRGHRNVVCFKGSRGGWSIGLRAWTFVDSAKEAGLNVQTLQVEESPAHDLWAMQGLTATAKMLVDRYVSMTPRPTGIFVLEERLLPAIDEALFTRGIKTGRNGEVDLISCYNENPRRVGLRSDIATINLRTDLVGKHGVAQLAKRMSGPGLERATLLVEPVLITPDDRRM